jgi:putative hemolysin
MTEDQWLHIVGLFFLFIFSAFFSGSETALMSMDTLRVKYLAEKDRPGARKLAEILARPDKLLGAILVGNNLVNIMVSVFASSPRCCWFLPKSVPRPMLLNTRKKSPLLSSTRFVSSCGCCAP